MTATTIPTEPRDVALVQLRAALSSSIAALAAVIDHRAGKRADTPAAADLLEHAQHIRMAARDLRTIALRIDPARRFAEAATKFADHVHGAARGRLPNRIYADAERLRSLAAAAAAFNPNAILEV
jgi:hypothetical protein